MTQESVRPDPTRWLDEYGDFLFNYAMSRLRDREAAEEAVQETFVAGIKSLDQYSGKGVEAAWLIGILKRKVVDVIRARMRHKSGQEMEDQADLTESLFDENGKWRADPKLLGAQPDENLSKEDFWRELNDCIGGLPQKQADVFTLRELEEHSSDQICKDLELSSSNLWVLLHRARLRLAQCLKNKWALGGES